MEAYKLGQDIHALTASLLAGKKMEQVSKEERQAAKAVNFGLIYAMGAKGLRAYAEETYGVKMTLEQAETFRTRFFQAYSGIARWHQRIKQHPSKETRTLSGRLRISKEENVTGQYNTPVQGTAADITKVALGMLVSTLFETGAKIVGTIHDEIILEAPEGYAEETAISLKKTMELAGSRYLKRVPVVADVAIGDSWAEK